MTHTIPTPHPVFSASRVAEIMSDPRGPAIMPTGEQRAVIEHPLSGSALVIAGAGSGKTETMANRVVWLVANGLVAPGEVLGLTFTRKAAGELNERITGRLATFVERLTEQHARGSLTAAEAARAVTLAETLADGLDLPSVSTYNAFAAAVVQEFGALAGIAATAAVIDESTAWRLAREAVCRSTDPALAASNDRINTIVDRVLRLDHAVSDHLTSFDRVERVLVEFERVGALPYDDKTRSEHKVYAGIRDLLEAIGGTRIALRVAREFAAEKRRRGLMEFADQLSLAVETLHRFPRAASVLRERSRVVLLDEVQDTSVGQTRLLSHLFAGSSVMAVGDPHQSIYGFRGASADNLRSFHRDFASRDTDRRDHPSATLTLSVSWRNPSEILAAANTIVAPLASDAPIEVPSLRSKEEALGTPEHSGAAARFKRVECRFPETVDEEARQLAEWFHGARDEHLARKGTLPTGAVVFRSRRRMSMFADALRQVGIPAHIVGLGGLLSTPEVTEIVSTMRCLWYADAGTELIRVLASPRFRVGPRDLAGLRRAAAWFAERDIAQQRLSDEDRVATSALPDPDRQFTLIDTLDEIGAMASLDHAALAEISAVGRERLRDAGRTLRQLRQLVGRDIPSLIRAIEYSLRIDIELEAHPSRGQGGSASARANLEAFTDLVENFLATDEEGTLASTLEWLDRAGEIDQVAEHVPEPVPGTVQLLTVHGAKGLEWDLVAVPRLVDSEFPTKPKEGFGWLRAGELPDELRGDAAARPRLDWRIATTQAELLDRLGKRQRRVKGETVPIVGYADELADRHQAEERRLAYVAVTRAASRVLLSGSFWADAATPREPSVFLRELSDAGVIAELPLASEYEEKPTDRPERALLWPLDPLGARADAVLAAAAHLRERLERDPSEEPDTEYEHAAIHPTVELLLAERAAAREPATEFADRLTASTFHEFIEDPAAAERRRLRPVPVRPYRRTRVGNLFHEWVERRATTARGTVLALPDLEPEASDPERDEFSAEVELAPLIAQFEQSRFADRQPVAVELAVTIPFAGRSLVCKLDAVFREGDGESATYEVVDWKSGRPPANEAERASRFLQLDLYRHAYAQWAGIDPDRITVTLFYVAHGVELCGEGDRSFEELERMWISAITGPMERGPVVVES